MALSFDGWLIGISSLCIIIYCCIFGLIWFFKGKKTKAKLLSYIGLAIFFVGFVWLENCCDFLNILITGKNIDSTTFRILIIMSYMWVAPSVVIVMHIGAEFITPEKKRYIVGIYVILGVIYELFIFLEPGSFDFVYPEKSGENLIDENVVLGSPAGILYAILILSVIIFCGFGILIKAIQLEGILKKKYLLFSIGIIIWCVFSILEGLIYLGIALVFIRIVLIISLWFWYLGLREEPEKIKKTNTKKEIKVEGELFRIIKKPTLITEEEVSISKEKKICLVCKSKVGGVLFMCKECHSFYCKKCSDALINLENACWACYAPIDESKPVKPFKIDKEISEKPQKNPKYEKKI